MLQEEKRSLRRFVRAAQSEKETATGEEVGDGRPAWWRRRRGGVFCTQAINKGRMFRRGMSSQQGINTRKEFA